MWHSSEGILKYGASSTVLLVDQELSDYYRRLIPRYIDVRPQRYPAHVTIFRAELELAESKSLRQYDGETIFFNYNSRIFYHDGYFYLNVESGRLDEIRIGLGLSSHFDSVKGHHITIGNNR